MSSSVFVSGDRYGNDIVTLDNNQAGMVDTQVLSLWLWENRVVGGVLINGSEEQRKVVHLATSQQWLILDVPRLRGLVSPQEGLGHLIGNSLS